MKKKEFMFQRDNNTSKLNPLEELQQALQQETIQKEILLEEKEALVYFQIDI